MTTDDKDLHTAEHAAPDREQARTRVKGLVMLPPLPRRSQELLQLLTDPDLNILSLVEIIEETPALAGRILGVASSPFFKTSIPVRDVSDAIIRLLGLNLVRDISLSLVLSQPFDVRGCAGFDPMRYWKHAMMTATLGQKLAPVAAHEDAPMATQAYLAGLLHSLGLLALVHVAPDAMGRVFSAAADEPDVPLSDLEHRVLGLVHAAAGGEIAGAWQIPDPIAAAMRHHRDSAYRGEHWPLVAVVTLADIASKAYSDHGCRSEELDSLHPLKSALGIRSAVWDRVVERWREQVDDIDALAAVLAGAAS